MGSSEGGAIGASSAREARECSDLSAASSADTGQGDGVGSPAGLSRRPEN